MKFWVKASNEEITEGEAWFETGRLNTKRDNPRSFVKYMATYNGMTPNEWRKIAIRNTKLQYNITELYWFKL